MFWKNELLMRCSPLFRFLLDIERRLSRFHKIESDFVWISIFMFSLAHWKIIIDIFILRSGVGASSSLHRFFFLSSAAAVLSINGDQQSQSIVLIIFILPVMNLTHTT